MRTVHTARLLTAEPQLKIEAWETDHAGVWPFCPQRKLDGRARGTQVLRTLVSQASNNIVFSLPQAS